MPDGVASLHIVEYFDRMRRTHYHKRLTEIYYILEGEGEMELDGERHVRAAGRRDPHQTRLPPPGDRQAAGAQSYRSPAFDPADEWFD